MPIRLIYNHIEHHARYSGYDQLARYVDATPFIGGGIAHRRAHDIPPEKLKTYHYYHSNWYGGPALRRELEICARMMLPSHTLYHFLYAENDLRHTALWKFRLNNKIVGSFHQPPEYLDGHESDKRYITGVSAAVVMSESQIPYFEQYLPRKRIYHVPHGVDTTYWCPDPEAMKWPEPTFLVVGQWLRDIELVTNTIRRVNATGGGMKFRIVTFPGHTALFDGLDNVEVMTGIPDEQLRAEYRRAHALFLPLKMSSANNAVLEAMSCGTAVVSTGHGGVPEYVSPECSMLVEPGDVEGATEVLRVLARDEARVVTMGNVARERVVEKYSWPVVGKQMMAAYRSIL